jgi:pyruvate-formate lyase-activating enzyme
MTALKILCIGNNSVDTDHRVSDLAQENNSLNHGLIDDPTFEPELPGYYHTTVVDIPWGKLFNLVQRFDTVLMLDQPRSEWSHWKCLQATYKFMKELEKIGHSVIFRDNANVKKFMYWEDLLTKKNKSLCIYPWINMFTDNQDLKLCSRSPPTVASLETLSSWQHDKDFSLIRQKMLNGELLPDHCGVCYSYEKVGIESYRQFDSMDWLAQLDLSSIEDLKNIENPYYYEVHGGNNCNIKCRGCDPDNSRPIGVEEIKFNIIPPKDRGHDRSLRLSDNYYLPGPSTDHVNIDALDKTSMVYFQGGEPTIMPEVANFLSQCIEKNKTDFNLSMCTNGMKLSSKFVDQINQFSQVNFSFSIDGFGKINDYWRSGTEWNTVISNAHRLESMGHAISINTVPGIYNVTNLHLLFEFLDKEFPFTTVYLQLNYNHWQSAFNYPEPEKALESLEKCMNTSIYRSNGKSCKSGIDGLYQHYSNHPIFDPNGLKQFFEYNDQLDRVRGVKLDDYIPELEACRKYTLFS